MERHLPQLNTVIRTFANEVEAHLAQAVLDANGIDSNLIRDDAGGMMPWLQWLHPIRLVVREVDRIEAVELLDTPPGPILLPWASRRRWSPLVSLGAMLSRLAFLLLAASATLQAQAAAQSTKDPY